MLEVTYRKPSYNVMSKLMKVLILNHFPLFGSGSGTFTYNLALYLGEQGTTL
jgi:hypothetical protein